MTGSKSGLLERILGKKRQEISELRGRRLPAPPPRRSFDVRRGAGPLRLIAEIKRRSPSAGVLSTRLSVGERAQSYEAAGANAISVLCDRAFFDGAFEDLAEARQSSSLPLLCKDFILDPLQLDAARAFGADAVLLIVRCLTSQSLGELMHAARERELEPFVEVATLEEAQIAVGCEANLIGVNTRDLDTLEMDAARALHVLASLPSSATRVHLSGLATAGDVRRVAATAVDAALIGTALMRKDDPSELLAEMVNAAR